MDGSNMDVDRPAGDKERKVDKPDAPQSVVDLSDLSDYEESQNDEPPAQPAQCTIELSDDELESPPEADEATVLHICTHRKVDIAEEWDPRNSSLGVDVNSEVVHIDKEGRPYTQRMILLR
jgi:hypothetical protein